MIQEECWLLRDKYNGIADEAFSNDRLRLATGEPLAYVIGWVPFLDARIYLDSHPLIPRPETEYWTKQAIEILERMPGPIHVLDLCAGSGCIGIAILQAIPEAIVDFAEIDQSHHATIIRNLYENGIDEHRYRLYGGDLFENITGHYDAILTNPPYINPDKQTSVEQSVFDHEPHHALFGGTDGMEIIKRILQAAPQYLKKGGMLYIEHEPEQTDAIQAFCPGIHTCEDQFGVLRYSLFKENKIDNSI